ncbi:MAG TPA: bifunctional 5,10-methylenetetrahydrofolate dehydrogenase/5,10-methenyltetrahydrofolate cyclohydrolase [Candidatus Paceibacterota bacterium]|nr:bifunctional 5,10-methylenetetrahydrofolate dehydrogenase/5,10-methenyltetrahydrofolate cyclohydrolase [Candidatus Paceibacterota bacterium]
MIVDGKTIAEDIYAGLAPRFSALNKQVKLGIVVVGENSVIASFVKIKERSALRLGIEMVRKDLPESASEAEIISAIHALNEKADAVIVQLPLPKGISTNNVLSAVPNNMDVDALNPDVSEEKRFVHAPVALAAVEILERSQVEIKGARAVIVGAGRLVGAPSAWLLKKLGANVSVFSLEEGSIDDLKDADIIVSGAGTPGFIKPAHIKEGVALIDGGTSELNKRIAGDADPACAEKASVFTPVPGGVGPVAVAMIFRNLLNLLEHRSNVLTM